VSGHAWAMRQCEQGTFGPTADLLGCLLGGQIEFRLQLGGVFGRIGLAVHVPGQTSQGAQTHQRYNYNCFP